MGGICVGHTAIEHLDEGCEIVRMHDPHVDRHDKLLVRVAAPQIPGVFQPAFHHDCAHNQLRAVVGRVLGVVPKPSLAGIARLKESALKLARAMPIIAAQDIHLMPTKYSGGKRVRYEIAVDKYLRYGLSPGDSHCTMFVKSERFDVSAKVNPDPRAIQFRGSKYCVALAQYLQPIEHYVYETDRFSKGVVRTRNIAKGLNSVQRAELLRHKMAQFRDPLVLSLDASRFDKHVSTTLLSVEHSIYTAANPDPLFKQLLRKQLVNTVHAANGLKYVARGRRMSGDMNTALGNCLDMLIMLDAYMDHLAMSRWDCLDDGDDCLLIIEAEALPLVQSTVQPHFLEYGMVLKVENVARSLHKVVFCKSSIVEVAEARVKFVRDYRAVISKSLTGIRHWQDPNYRVKVLRAIGVCELVLNLGVPVLQAFALAVLRNVGRSNDTRLASDGLKARVSRELKGLGVALSDVRPREVTLAARVSFHEAFDCEIADQLYYENFFHGWQFDVSSLHHFGQETDIHSWLSYHSTAEVYPLRQNAENTSNQTEVATCQVATSS